MKRLAIFAAALVIAASLAFGASAANTAQTRAAAVNCTVWFGSGNCGSMYSTCCFSSAWVSSSSYARRVGVGVGLAACLPPYANIWVRYVRQNGTQQNIAYSPGGACGFGQALNSNGEYVKVQVRIGYSGGNPVSRAGGSYSQWY